MSCNGRSGPVFVCLPCRQRELEEAAALTASAVQGSGSRSGGSVSSRSGKAQRVTFGADDLLAALTWVVVQVRETESCDRETPSFFQSQASSDDGGYIPFLQIRPAPAVRARLG